MKPLSGAQLKQRFLELDAFLLEHQALWRPKPFTELCLAWESRYPQLSHWLRQRSLAEAEAAHNTPECLPAPAPYPQLAQHAHALSALPEYPQQTLTAPPSRLNSAIPGRKWQQINAFAGALNFAQPPQHWLDWCAGKGHLGRRLSYLGGVLSCWEYDPALVVAGQQLSQRLQIPAQHHLQDVLAEHTAQQLAAHHTPVALHACGELHIRLLELASRNGCTQLAVAPCCYNRINSTHYQPLSAAAQASSLQLSQDELGLPLSETVTAGQRQRQQRDQSMAQRLAFDLLQRQLRNTQHYLPTPSLPSSWLHKTFAQYCCDLAQLKGMRIDQPIDWPTLEQQGWQRLAEVRNLELVRGLFRRPLEIWLLLDRALFLQEQGFSVQLGTFCPANLTPRNALLLAEKPV